MPCIVCKKDRWSIFRIPLETLTEAREHYFREMYFTNFEFDHVCRFCSLNDTVVGTFINTLGWILNLAMRSWLVALGVLICYAACLKLGLKGRPAEVAPVLGGLFVAGVLGIRFVRWFFFVSGGFVALVLLIVGLMYSDMLSILPDVQAMVNREKLGQGDEVRISQEDRDAYVRMLISQGVSPEAARKTPVDPIAASEARASERRWNRVVGLAQVLRTHSPIAVEMSLDQFKVYLRLTGLTLVIYVVGVALGAWLFGGVARDAEAKRRGKRRDRVG